MTLAGYVVLGVERQERVVFDRRLISLMMRESVARCLFWLMQPLGAISSSPVRVPVAEDAAARPPVLLIAGSSVNRSGFGFLATFLQQRGFAWVWSVNSRHAKVGIVEAAGDLQASVDRLRAASGADTIDLCAFGTGGLVAAWYARHIAPSGQVRRLVTIGTPWGGTKLSVFRRGRLGEDLLFGSHLLDDLVPAIETHTIWSQYDPTVIPSESAVPDGVKAVEIDSAGHADMLLSSRVYRAVQEALL